MWTHCIKDKDTEAPTEAAFEVDPDPQEAVVEATMEATKEASDETEIQDKIHRTEGITTKTILKQDPKITKLPLLTEEAPVETIMVEKGHLLLDSKARQESGVQIVAKLRTTQPNVGAIRKRQSMMSTTTRKNNLKTNRKTHLIVTQFNGSSKQKTKNWFLQSTGRESKSNNP
jgi:hypothetical protein